MKKFKKFLFKISLCSLVVAMFAITGSYFSILASNQYELSNGVGGIYFPQGRESMYTSVSKAQDGTFYMSLGKYFPKTKVTGITPTLISNDYLGYNYYYDGSSRYIGIEDATVEGGIVYFKLEQVRWRVAGYYKNGVLHPFTQESYDAKIENQLVLVTEQLIDVQQWNTSDDDVDWKDSTILQWINDEFKSNATSGAYLRQRSYTYTDTSTTIDPSQEAELGMSGYCWLLSEKDIKDMNLSETMDFSSGTDFYNYKKTKDGFWTRTSYNVDGVTYASCINGESSGCVASDFLGVRVGMICDIWETNKNWTPNV